MARTCLLISGHPSINTQAAKACICTGSGAVCGLLCVAKGVLTGKTALPRPADVSWRL